MVSITYTSYSIELGKRFASYGYWLFRKLVVDIAWNHMECYSLAIKAVTWHDETGIKCSAYFTSKTTGFLLISCRVLEHSRKAPKQPEYAIQLWLTLDRGAKADDVETWFWVAKGTLAKVMELQVASRTAQGLALRSSSRAVGSKSGSGLMR